MRALLDTHVFIWWESDLSRLSPEVRTICEDTNNQLMLSVISIWEIQIKHQLGKLHLHLPLREIIQKQQELNRVKLLGVNTSHVLQLENIPLYHHDPFDRLLIAQAQVEQISIISHDAQFKNYAVEVIW